MPRITANQKVHYLMQVKNYDLAEDENTRWFHSGQLTRAEYLANRALMALPLGKIPLALELLTEALSLSPDNDDIAACLVFLWQCLGEHDRAVSVHAARGSSQAQAGAVGAGDEAYDITSHRKECYRHHLDQALNYQSFQYFDNADKELREARMLFPKKSEVHLAEGKNHLSAKRWENAIVAFEKAASLAKDEEMKSECLTYLAITYLRIEHRAKAEDYLMEALDHNPPYMGALMLSDYLFSRRSHDSTGAEAR